MFGFFRRNRKQIIKENQEQGRRGEERVKMRRELQGWKMTRTGKGHDYKATRTNRLTGRKETEHVEVKTGNAKLSPLQKKKKRQYGSRYVVENGDSVLDVNFSKFRSSSSSSSGSLTTSKRSNARGRKATSPKKPRVKKSGKAASIGNLLWGASNTSPTRRSTASKTKSRKATDSLLGGSGSLSSTSLWGSVKRSKTGGSGRSRKKSQGGIWFV